MSPELQLVLAAAPSIPSPAALASIPALASAALDWDLVMTLAHVHRVRPCVVRNLRSFLPPDQLDRLEQECAAVSAHNHFLAGELLTILRPLASQGIEAIAFKGPALAHQLHGNIALTEFSDLDLLVPRPMVWQAVGILEKQGYRCAFSGSGQARQTLLDLECEVMLTHPAGHTVDLHWDFTASYFRPFPIQPPVEPIALELLGSPVLTLSPRDATLFAIGHLSRHGSWCAKGTAEFASILAAFDPAHWEGILRRASLQGCRRMALFGVAAAARFHQAVIPAAVEPLLRPAPEWIERALDVTASWLAAASDQPPAVLSRLRMRLSHLDSTALRLGHTVRYLSTPRPPLWRRFPLLGRIARFGVTR
jgi:hypothetical protein